MNTDHVSGMCFSHFFRSILLSTDNLLSSEFFSVGERMVSSWREKEGGHGHGGIALTPNGCGLMSGSVVFSSLLQLSCLFHLTTCEALSSVCLLVYSPVLVSSPSSAVQRNMANQLSGVAIVICIAIGFTTFILLFIFGKRQIMRFALKSRRGPHFPIASDAPKHLRKEIERRLDAVKDIRHDPILNGKDEDITCLTDEITEDPPAFPHTYRMKAVDSFKLLETDIVDSCNGDLSKRKPPGQDLRFYLQRLTRNGGPLVYVEDELINSFVDSYTHARHDPTPFGEVEYKKHIKILEEVRDAMKNRTSIPVPKTTGCSKVNKEKSPSPKKSSSSITGGINSKLKGKESSETSV